MKRRELAAALLVAAVWPHAVFAQQPRRTPVIGFLVLANPEPIFGYFKEGLRALGYEDGKNIRIEFRNAEGKSERLVTLAAELVRLDVDVLVASQTPAVIAAKRATGRIPIVMASAGDPVGTGLIASLARPGGNITGMSGTTAELGGKILELVREILPKAARVGVLANATDPFTKPFLDQLQRAAPSAALEITPTMIRETAEIGPAISDMITKRTDAVIVQPSLQRKVAADLALKNRLPAVSPSSLFAGEGGLVSYSANQAEMHRKAASYVDRILRGAKPADLPVQQPTTYELIVNLKTANVLGVTIPMVVRLRADRIIE